MTCDVMCMMHRADWWVRLIARDSPALQRRSSVMPFALAACAAKPSSFRRTMPAEQQRRPGGSHLILIPSSHHRGRRASLRRLLCFALLCRQIDERLLGRLIESPNTVQVAVLCADRRRRLHRRIAVSPSSSPSLSSSFSQRIGARGLFRLCSFRAVGGSPRPSTHTPHRPQGPLAFDAP